MRKSVNLRAEGVVFARHVPEALRPKSSSLIVGTACANVTVPPQGGMIFDKSIVPLRISREVLALVSTCFLKWSHKPQLPRRFIPRFHFVS